MSETEARYINTIDVFTPVIKVSFYTAEGVVNVQSQDISDANSDIIACQTYKDIQQPAGMFSVHLVDRRRFDEILNPMDVVSIQMDNHKSFNSKINKRIDLNQSPSHATMVGLIDSVKRKRIINPETGKPQIFCEVKGRDFGKLLIKHQIRYLPWILDNEQGKRMSQALKALFSYLLSGLTTGGDVAQLMRNNLLRLFSSAVNMKFAYGEQTLNLRDVISYRFSTGMGHIPYNPGLQSSEGSLWNVLLKFANFPWNELWIDSVNAPNEVIPGSTINVVNGKSITTPGICRENYSTPLNPLNPTNPSPEMDLVTKMNIEAATATRRKEWSELVGQYGKAANVEDKTAKEIELDERKTEFGFGEDQKIKDIIYQQPPEIRGGTQIDGAYIMVFSRQTPFDDARWALLRKYRSYEITNDDIQEQDLGKQDHEVFNYYFTRPILAAPDDIPLPALGIYPIFLSNKTQIDTKLVNGEPSLLENPTQFPSAVEKYGLNMLDLQTRVWAMEEGALNLDVKKVTSRLVVALTNWNKWNAELVSGALTIKGAPNIHVGDMLVNVDDNTEFYVEAVTNNYIQYQPMTTSLILTRGQKSGQYVWGNVMQDLDANNQKLQQKPNSAESNITKAQPIGYFP